MPNASIKPKPNALYRVFFRDGTLVTTTARSSLLAEQKAQRSRPGVIIKTQFVKVSQ